MVHNHIHFIFIFCLNLNLNDTLWIGRKVKMESGKRRYAPQDSYWGATSSNIIILNICWGFEAFVYLCNFVFVYMCILDKTYGGTVFDILESPAFKKYNMVFRWASISIVLVVITHSLTESLIETGDWRSLMFDSSPTTSLLFFQMEIICVVTMITTVSLVTLVRMVIPVNLVTLVSPISLVIQEGLVTMDGVVILGV